jgi:hypothetical protein
MQIMHTLAKFDGTKLSAAQIELLEQYGKSCPLSVLVAEFGILVNTNEFELLNLSLLEVGLRDFYEETGYPGYILINWEF